jgi:hypothetical protein
LNIRRLRVRVTVKPQSRIEQVSRLDDGSLLVRVREPAKENRANQAVVAAVAGFYGVPKSSLRLVSGARSRHKVLEITD